MNLQQTAVNLMLVINRLTPDIKNKATDPDWFLLRQQIEKGLLDAYKAGMTEAAEIANYRELEFKNPHYKSAAGQVKQAILSARDKKETI